MKHRYLTLPYIITKAILSGIVVSVSMTLVSIVFAATPEASMLANTCTGCHGTNGSSVGPASPTIAGISPDYFIESMEEYASGKRPSTIMQRIAKGYSKREIELMAHYFAKQPFVRQSQLYDTGLAKQGKALHKKYCEKCHENEGRSAEDDAGILAGQWSLYLRYMMDDYISGRREMTKKMKKRVKKLQDAHGHAGIEKLVHFYASQSK